MHVGTSASRTKLRFIGNKVDLRNPKTMQSLFSDIIEHKDIGSKFKLVDVDTL